jgi:hypothetical protein
MNPKSIPNTEKKDLASLWRELEETAANAASALQAKQYYQRAAQMLEIAELANLRACTFEGTTGITRGNK